MDKINDSGWIYESPDGGKTVTRRRLGADISTRETLTEKQQTKLFNDEQNISNRR